MIGAMIYIYELYTQHTVLYDESTHTQRCVRTVRYDYRRHHLELVPFSAVRSKVEHITVQYSTVLYPKVNSR
jgi:hypothetical protein